MRQKMSAKDGLLFRRAALMAIYGAWYVGTFGWPEGVWPFAGSSLMIERESIVFPQPDSPTIPSLQVWTVARCRVASRAGGGSFMRAVAWSWVLHHVPMFATVGVLLAPGHALRSALVPFVGALAGTLLLLGLTAQRSPGLFRGLAACMPFCFPEFGAPCDAPDDVDR